jgi:hypothetical protein
MEEQDAGSEDGCRTVVTTRWHDPTRMRPTTLGIIALRRELASRYAATIRQWITARATYRRLHEAPVKNLVALRDAARRLDQLEQGRASLLRDLKALAD